jgi:hypothetical protein
MAITWNVVSLAYHRRGEHHVQAPLSHSPACAHERSVFVLTRLLTSHSTRCNTMSALRDRGQGRMFWVGRAAQKYAGENFSPLHSASELW